MKVIRKMIFGFFLLYSFNLIAVNFNINIPINLFTVLFVMFLDVPGMITLLVSILFVF